MQTRRSFLQVAAAAAASASALAQIPGERPIQAGDVKIINPRARVPVGWIIDDSTCLVNLNRFAMPQFDEAFRGANSAYQRNWREWPAEIPDAFVRKFGEWCTSEGVKGKYSIVPYPACVGRVDRELPGWTRREVEASLDLVRTLMMPNWDIHPEMVTHTRVIDITTGHPYPQTTTKFMENWDWTTGRSADEIGSYLAYALGILKNVGLTCEGVTTPGGFANRARPQLAQATAEAVRSVFGAEIPHYFRDTFASGDTSVAPLVQNVKKLGEQPPDLVVHVQGCTGDWTGGWDCSEPTGADAFITEDLQHGRVVEIIERGEPALMLAHWTGIYFNGAETGFSIFKEVTKRLRSRFDHLIWMKLSEVARYWAAKELTAVARAENTVTLNAPIACPDLTLRYTSRAGTLHRKQGAESVPLRKVDNLRLLVPDTYCHINNELTVCVPVAVGETTLTLS